MPEATEEQLQNIAAMKAKAAAPAEPKAKQTSRRPAPDQPPGQAQAPGQHPDQHPDQAQALTHQDGGMAASLAEKSATARNAAIATADRDSITFAKTYLGRFDANMQAINGKLTQAWGTVGAFDKLAEGEELPPFEKQLDELLVG